VLNKVLGALAAIAGFAALFFRGQAYKEKSERSEARAEMTEKVKEQSDRATEAMIRGVENENKKAKRGSFDAVRDRLRKR
jgi:hypothetical protein